MHRLDETLAAFDADLPLARARTIPSGWYFDPEIYALECRAVFGGIWQYACRLEQVRAAGAFVTLEIAGEPVVVVRDEEGTLHAHSNVCRHRAAQVVGQPEGTLTRLRCPYHGWTYDLAGRLRGTPEFDGVEDFCRDEAGLVPLAVGTCGPFVFVHHGTPKQPLEEFLSPFPERTGGLGLEQLRHAGRRAYDLDCNWKVFVDNFQDGGYHVNAVHPGLAGVLDYAQYRVDNFSWSSVQSSPMKPADDPALGRVRGGERAWYWWIFPNFMVNLYEGMMDTNLVLPLGTDRCRVLFDFYFAPTGAADRSFVDESIAVAHQVQLEDRGVCEAVQRGLRSRAYETGRFSVRREAGGYHFHRLLAKRLREAAAGNG